MSKTVDLLKEKAIVVTLMMLIIMGGIWIMYLLNNLILSGSLSYGVHPREVSIKDMFGIMFSWIFHSDKNHIMNNSVALLTMLPLIAILERRPWLILSLLIIVSGFLTWCLGSSNSNHIGASGLIFAIMGYIFTAATFGKKPIYWIPILISGGSYWYSIKMGLIPQSGISFAGHFGGLIAGIIIGFIVAYEDKKEVVNKPLYKMPTRAVPWSELGKKKKPWYKFGK